MKPFLQGKKALPVEPLRVTSHGTPAAGRRTEVPAHAHAAHAGPVDHGRHGNGAGGNAHVDVIKEGDKVVRLVVTCACGERVEIECLYSAGR
jgi:hypothetical protein